jgi:hypothetical protein
MQVPPRVGTPTGISPATSAPTTATPRGVGVNGTGDKRGKKRDFEEARAAGAGGGGVVANGNVNGVGSGGGNVVKAVVNAKAGIAGARPRPIKKQRMVCDFVFRICNYGVGIMAPVCADCLVLLIGYPGSGARRNCACAATADAAGRIT